MSNATQASALTAVPSVTVTARGAARARAGHPWIFRADVASAPPRLAAGAEVRATDARGNFIARAFWAAKSPIALRLFSRKDEPLDTAFLRERLAAALSRRRELGFAEAAPGQAGSGRAAPAQQGSAQAYRLAHGEADLLPGYFVDVYGAVASVQHLAEWAEARREELAALVSEVSGASSVVARDDGSARDFEGLPRRKGALLGPAPGEVRYREGEVELSVDLLTDHKTGGYLDQRENHLLAGALARGNALDAFCYHGGFALQLSSSSAPWTKRGVDSMWWCSTRPRSPSGATAWRRRCASTKRSTTAARACSRRAGSSSPAPAPARSRPSCSARW